MDFFYAYTYATSAWLALQGVTLLSAPKLIVASILDETRQASVCETYFARSSGIALVAMSQMAMIFTGIIPLTSSYAITDEDEDPKAPYAYPMLMITSAYHAATATYAYIWFSSEGQAAFAIGMAVSGALASAGLWCILFGTSEGRISKKTGADKRTSGFPFDNAEADKKRSKKKL